MRFSLGCPPFLHPLRNGYPFCSRTSSIIRGHQTPHVRTSPSYALRLHVATWTAPPQAGGRGVSRVPSGKRLCVHQVSDSGAPHLVWRDSDVMNWPSMTFDTLGSARPSCVFAAQYWARGTYGAPVA